MIITETKIRVRVPNVDSVTDAECDLVAEAVNGIDFVGIVRSQIPSPTMEKLTIEVDDD